MLDLSKLFVDKGIYKLNTVSDSIFLCESLTGNRIGKLVTYKLLSENCWERTNNSYFLTTYSSDNVKSIFVVRENYDMLGMIDNNYLFYNDKKFIKKI